MLQDSSDQKLKDGGRGGMRGRVGEREGEAAGETKDPGANERTSV